MEIGRLREEVKSLTGAVAERNTAMSELAELRSELADAKRALDTSTFAGTSLEEVEAARDKAEHELLTMARRVTALEQQLFEAQRAQEEAAAEIEHKVDASSRGDKDAIEKLKVKCDELETAQKEAECGVGKLTADLKAAREAISNASTEESTSGKAPATRVALTSMTGKPASRPFSLADFRPFSTPGMYSLGTAPPTMADSNTKSVPGSPGSISKGAKSPRPGALSHHSVFEPQTRVSGTQMLSSPAWWPYCESWSGWPTACSPGKITRNVGSRWK